MTASKHRERERERRRDRDGVRNECCFKRYLGCPVKMEYLCHLWHERPSKRVPWTCSRCLLQSLPLTLYLWLSSSLSPSLSQSPLTTFLHICSTKRTKWNAQKISWQDKAKPKIKRSQIGQQPPLPSPALPHPALSPSLKPRRRKANRKRKISVGRYEHMDIWTFGSSSSSRCLWVAAGGGPFAYWNDWTRSLGSRVPGPERETRLGPQQTIVCTTSPKTRDKTRRDETKDRHTAHKKWDLCGVSFRQRENVMRFYDFISDNRPWNLMDTTWGSLVCCSAPHSHSHFNFFVWQTNLSLFFVHFLEFSCIFLALDEQQQQQPQNESCTQTNQKFCARNQSGENV